MLLVNYVLQKRGSDERHLVNEWGTSGLFFFSGKDNTFI